MKKLKKETEIRSQKKCTKLVLFVVAIFVLLSTVRVILANSLVEVSDKLHRLDVQEGLLANENENLRIEIAQRSSLSKMWQEAKDLGFVEVTKIVQIDLPSPLAAKAP